MSGIVGCRDRCRCCYAQTAELKLCQLYEERLASRTYSDTICQTFGLSPDDFLIKSEGNICRSCVGRLKEASEFKDLMLRTGRRLKQFRSSPRIYASKLKLEVDIKHDFETDIDDAFDDPDYSDNDNKPLKKLHEISDAEKIEENVRKALSVADRARNICKKTRTLKMDKLLQVNQYVRNLVDGTERYASNPLKVQVQPLKIPIKGSILKCAPRNMKLRVPGFTSKTIHCLHLKSKVNAVNLRTSNIVGSIVLPSEKRAAREIVKRNAFLILKHTTACPFTYYHGNFKCFYCSKNFFNFLELKNHTNSCHDSSEAFKPRALRDIVMVDITDLKCKVCHSEYSDIDSIKTHLVSNHNVAINMAHKDDIAGFKLSSDLFRCHICGEEHHVFRNLCLHLNKHYANYMCDVCGKPFISYERYRNHEKTHTQGTFKCSKCDVVFDTFKARAAHMVAEHYRHKSTRYGCPMCSARFEKYLERTVHMSTVHAVHHRFQCPFCSKEFFHRPHMQAHISNMHKVKEKKVECTECGMRFKENNSLARHMVTHTGEKLFGCRHCGKKYGRKWNLEVHMRVHSKSHLRRTENMY